MMTAPHLDMIRTRLRDKMLAQLAMRWKEANAYIPPGSVKVHCAQPLPDADQEGFDMYVLAYQNAIEDVLDMLDKSSDKPERPHALVMAEASVFQGGKPVPDAQKRHGNRSKETDKSREARRKLEDMFSGGGQ